MKKIGSLMLILALGVWGCVTVDNATVVDTDQSGYATGQFRDTRNGRVANFGVFGSGAGGAASATGSALAIGLQGISQVGPSNTSGLGGGMLGLRVYPAPTQGDPVPFARAVAMINYSKKLKSIKYDESGGVIEYDFNEQPLTQRRVGKLAPSASTPSSGAFGYQPVE